MKVAFILPPATLWTFTSTLLLSFVTFGQSQDPAPSAPTLTQFSSYDALEGTNAILECTVTNKGNYDLFWYFNPDNDPGDDGHLIGHGDFADSYKYPRFSVVSNVELGQYNLRITKLQLSDAGLYTCTLADSGLPASVGRLTVLQPTAPTSGPICNLNKLNFKEGETINGTCIASSGGITSSTLQWYDGRGISVTVRQKDESDLLRKAHPRDDGKTFKCRETHIALRKPRDCVTETLQVFHKPQLVFYPADKTAELESSATLTCRSTSNPVVQEARIFINDTRLYTNDSSSVDSRFSLTIIDTDKGKDLKFTVRNFQKDDYSLIVLCQAWNEEGERNWTTKFKEPPPSGDGFDALFIIGVDLAALFGLVSISVCLLSCKPVGARLCGPLRDSYRARRRRSEA